jgi:hypothetical protein
MFVADHISGPSEMLAFCCADPTRCADSLVPSESGSTLKEPTKTGYGCCSFHNRQADNVAGIAWTAAIPSLRPIPERSKSRSQNNNGNKGDKRADDSNHDDIEITFAMRRSATGQRRRNRAIIRLSNDWIVDNGTERGSIRSDCLHLPLLIAAASNLLKQ